MPPTADHVPAGSPPIVAPFLAKGSIDDREARCSRQPRDALFFRPVVAQSEEELVGVWTVTKSEAVRPDGTKSATFGTNPYSQLILTANGRFSQIFIRSDIPKFAANSRQHGTPEENAAAVKGSNAEFGSWSLAGKDFTLKIEQATFRIGPA